MVPCLICLQGTGQLCIVLGHNAVSILDPAHPHALLSTVHCADKSILYPFVKEWEHGNIVKVKLKIVIWVRPKKKVCYR